MAKRTRLAVLAFALAAFVVLLVLGTLFTARERNLAAESLASLIEALAAAGGDPAAGRAYLTAEAWQKGEVVSSLAVLAANPELPRLEPAIRPGFLAFALRRELAARLDTRDGTVWPGFRMRKGDGGWQVAGLPDVLAHPAALLVTEDSGRSRLLIRGRELDIQSDVPRPPGYEAGFAVLNSGRMVAFEPAAPPRALSMLVRYTPGGPLETELEGLLPVWPSGLAVYDLTTAAPSFRGTLIPGTGGLTAYLWREKVCAIGQAEPFRPDRVRVALNTSGFAGLAHSRVTVSSDGGLVIRDKVAGRRVSVRPGTVVVFRRTGTSVLAETTTGMPLIESGLRLHVAPSGEGKIQVGSLVRGHAGGEFAPEYRGYLEIAPGAASGLLVVNDLPLNEYLYSVVPSEMPAAFGLESLKAQAMAARAYAVASMFAGGYAALGAHLEDSVLSQVYNNVPEVPAGNQAVDATGLEVPVFQGEIVDARFFSTSCGFTANAHEVWSTGDSFPGEVVPYLRAVPQTSDFRTIPDEETMAAFLWRADLDAPDAGAPFFRWTVTLSRAECEAVIRANLRARYDAQPGFVLTADGKGDFQSRAVPLGDPVGTLKDLRVVQRGEGGNAMVLELSGSAGTYRVIKEYNIRTTLRPVQHLMGGQPIVLRLLDGSTRGNYSILPSAFFVLEVERDASGEISQVRITGGGNGHGAGMSQTGARGLAGGGRTYRDIIMHYYPGAEIVDLAAETLRLPQKTAR